MVSGGVRLSEVGLEEIPKPRLTMDSILAPIWCQNTLTHHDSRARTTNLVLNPPLRRNFLPRQNWFYRADKTSSFFGAGGVGAGVIRVLKKEAIWHRKIPREATISMWLKTRIASNDKGITYVINDLSNPPGAYL